MFLTKDWIVGFAWGVGTYIHDKSDYFLLRHHDRNLLAKIAETIGTKTSPQFRSTGGAALRIHPEHEFVKRLNDLGWTSRLDKTRKYPEGEVDHEEFISGYFYTKAAFIPSKRPGYYGKLTVEGAEAVLQAIDDYIVFSIGTMPKKIFRRITRKITYPEYESFILKYQSKYEIPYIMQRFSLPRESIRKRMYQEE